jgi:hypothetical protein
MRFNHNANSLIEAFGVDEKFVDYVISITKDKDTFKKEFG